MGIFSSLVVATCMTFGQADDGLKPTLEPMAPLLGTWDVTFNWPGLPKNNQVTIKPALGGKYIESRWYNMKGEEVGPEIFTFDPVRKTIRMWGFDGTSFYEATWRVDGKKRIGKYSGTNFTGEEYKSTIVLEFVNDSLCTATMTPEGANKPTGFAKFRKVKDE